MGSHDIVHLDNRSQLESFRTPHPQGYLAMSGDFWLSQLGVVVGGSTGIYWVKSRDTAKPFTQSSPPPPAIIQSKLPVVSNFRNPGRK